MSDSQHDVPLMREDTCAVDIDATIPKRRKVRATTPLGLLVRFFSFFPVQCAMLLLTFIDIGFLIYEFSTQNTQYETVTLITALMFFLEVIVNVGYNGKEAFRFDKWWVVAEVVIVTSSFAVEYTEYVLHFALGDGRLTTSIRYLRAARFLRIAILWKTRWRHFTAALRRLVSADRRRYQAGGYDLDLTYVYSNVIATSWPSEGREGMYRNHINNVAAFLDDMHKDAYVVYNLCSERSYDESKFHDRVRRYRLDDHNPPELMMMLEFAKDAHEWLKQEQSRVAVIHCKGGKGRTGTMTCALLLFAKMQPNAQAALHHFGTMRTSEDAKNFQGVESPSQYRYVHYFDRLLQMPGMVPPQRTVRITKFRLDHVPFVWWSKGIDKLWYAVILNPCGDRKLHYISNPTITFDPRLPENPYGSPSKRRGMSVSPTVQSPTSPSFDSDSPSFVECQPFAGNYVVYAGGDFSQVMDCEQFNMKHGAVRNGTVVPEGKLDKRLRVTLDISTSSIPPISGDVVIKFFFNEDMPNTLHAPLQLWFHVGMEEGRDRLLFKRDDIDGPHKDRKAKKFPADITIDVGLETVSPTTPSTPPQGSASSAPEDAAAVAVAVAVAAEEAPGPAEEEAAAADVTATDVPADIRE